MSGPARGCITALLMYGVVSIFIATALITGIPTGPITGGRYGTHGDIL